MHCPIWVTSALFYSWFVWRLEDSQDSHCCVWLGVYLPSFQQGWWACWLHPFEHDIDIFFMTKTWLCDSDDPKCKELSMAGYQIMSFPHPSWVVLQGSFSRLLFFLWLSPLYHHHLSSDSTPHQSLFTVPCIGIGIPGKSEKTLW